MPSYIEKSLRFRWLDTIADTITDQPSNYRKDNSCNCNVKTIFRKVKLLLRMKLKLFSTNVYFGVTRIRFGEIV